MSILLHHFEKAGHEVHLILIGRKREVLLPIPETITIHRPSWPFNNSYRTFHTLRTMVFLRRTIGDIQPDVTLSFGEYWNNLVLLSLTGAVCPVYISDRSMPGKNLGRFQNFLRNRLYPGAAGYIAQTEKAATVARQKRWNKKISVIGNPVPAIPHVSQAKRKTILNVGRLIRTKNIDRLIEMFSRCREELRREWHLTIVGGDAKKQQLSAELNKQVERLGLRGKVSLEGMQKQILPYYQESAIFAFTSTSEGFPNALAEAMSAGLAVIAYDCVAGPADLIDDGLNGFLIPEGDEHLYLQRLQLLMSDENLRMKFGEQARKKMECFRADVIAETYLNFIAPR